MGGSGLVTWRTDDGRGFEGARVLLHDGGLRALGRMVRAGTGAADPPFTASYRLDAGDGGRVRRLAVTSATAGRERYLTLNRTDDGFWLHDTGLGSGRLDVTEAVDVDLAFSPLFNSVPIRRLGLHRATGDHVLSILFVALPQRRHRAVPLFDDLHRQVRQRDEQDAQHVVAGRAVQAQPADGHAVEQR